MLHAELRVIGGKQDGKVISLTRQKFLVGREQDCHLRPNSDLVSRHHCVFTLDDYGLRLRDLGSTNGTVVNGQRIQGQQMLKTGDRVEIGKLVFEVRLREAVAVASATTVVPGSDDSRVISAEALSADTTELSGSDTSFDLPVPDFTREAAAATPTAPEGDTVISLNAETQAVPMTAGVRPESPPAIPAAPTGYELPPPQAPLPYPPMPGYAPQPMYGYPQVPYGQMPYPPMPYPQVPMQYPLPGMYPPQPVLYGASAPSAVPEPISPESPAAESRPKNVAAPAIQLPDPATTGAAPPSAPPPPTPEEQAQKQAAAAANPSAKAADIIKKYLQRRPDV